MEFERSVKAVIRAIPRGKVATYGQVAALAGDHRAARQVARVLHSSSEKEGLPWHRVINSRGGISLRPGRGFERQRRLLAAEGVPTGRAGVVDLAEYRWEPRGAPSEAARRFLRGLSKSGDAS
jgi:methylated-DNA-protein-cysteine methyltransferase-like protein